MSILYWTFQRGEQKKVRGAFSPIVMILGSLVFINQAAAQDASAVQRLPVWYEDTLVTQLRASGDEIAIANKDELPEHIPQPLYIVVGGGTPQELPVIGLIPGDIGYTGWWNVVITLNLSGRDHLTNPFTNVGEIESLLCTIPGFPGNIPACLANGTPLFDLTGTVEDIPLRNIPIVQSAPPPEICNQ